MITKERIDSVRKTQKEYLKERMLQHGIIDHEDLLTELKVSFSYDDRDTEIWNNTIRSLRNKLKQVSLGEVFFKGISTERLGISFTRDINHEHVFEILKWGAKCNIDTARRHAVHIHIQGNDLRFNDGYGLLSEADVADNKHGKTYHMRVRGADSYRILNLRTLVASVMLRNTLWEYGRVNLLKVRRYFIRSLVQQRMKTSYHSELIAPDESWQPLIDEMNELEPGICNWNNQNRIVSVANGISPLLWKLLQGMDFWSLLNLEEHRTVREKFFLLALIPFLKELNILQDDSRAREESYASHAKVWQLKKNIPEKTLSRMRNNVFLERYSSVELDADVDLQKFSEIEKEFRRFMILITIPKYKGSFRIRKLGNYRADGLHFPYHRATCIDLDGIDAYGHELAHQLDYSFQGNGERLSDQFRFLKVYDQYESSVQKAIHRLPKDHPFRTQWYGKTKYNRQYYLRPTEVFARSYELYLHEILGIRSSFLQETYDHAVYPKDSSYLAAVETYFGDVFPISPPAESKVQEELQTSQPALASVYEHVDFILDPGTNQLIFPI